MEKKKLAYSLFVFCFCGAANVESVYKVKVTDLLRERVRSYACPISLRSLSNEDIDKMYEACNGNYDMLVSAIDIYVLKYPDITQLVKTVVHWLNCATIH